MYILLKKQESQPRRLTGIFHGLWWFFLRLLGSRVQDGRDRRGAVPTARMSEELCPIIYIAVYIVRLRNGGSLAWTTIWPSVRSVVLPWSGRMAISLPLILTLNPRRTVKRLAGAKANADYSSRRPAPVICSGLRGRAKLMPYPTPPCFLRILVYSKVTSGEELPTLPSLLRTLNLQP
jgi:hypothetical protein